MLVQQEQTVELQQPATKQLGLVLEWWHCSQHSCVRRGQLNYKIAALEGDTGSVFAKRRKPEALFFFNFYPRRRKPKKSMEHLLPCSVYAYPSIDGKRRFWKAQQCRRVQIFMVMYFEHISLVFSEVL